MKTEKYNSNSTEEKKATQEISSRSLKIYPRETEAIRLRLSDVFEYRHINTLDLEESAAFVAAVASNQVDLFNFGPQMDKNQIKQLSFDLCEIFSHDTLADISLMFKMFRQGKIGVNPMKPVKAFDQYHICKILVPEYLDLKADERVRYNKSKDFTPMDLQANLIRNLKKIKDDDSLEKIDFSVRQEADQEPVTDEFKKSVESLSYAQLNDWIFRNRGYARLKEKIKYAREELRKKKV